jgi:hypothetical protein
MTIDKSRMLPTQGRMSCQSGRKHRGHTSPQSRPPTSKARGIVKTISVKLTRELRNRMSHHDANMARTGGGRNKRPGSGVEDCEEAREMQCSRGLGFNSDDDGSHHT